MTGVNEVKPEEGRRTLWRDQRGMALLITVVTVSLLVALTIQYHKTTWQQYLVANNYRVGTQLEAIADSGVNIAEALLQQDGKENQFDSFFDSWAALGQEQFGGLFPSGTLRLQVVDLSGRLQVNSLVRTTGGTGGAGSNDSGTRAAFIRLLMSGMFPIEDETQARSIVDSLVDWIDADDQESDLGAESSYYESLTKPYSCRNGPVRYIEELLLVKGITPELLFGSGGNRGLADYLTVNGDDGKVNLNTAPLLVIKSLAPDISDDVLLKLDEYRKDIKNKESLAAVGWYNTIDGWPGDIVINESLLTNSSSYFQIIATGQLDTRSRSVVAVVQRTSSSENQIEVKLLGKKTE